MKILCACGHEYETRSLPCPDGREGCLVAHMDRASYACTSCGRDNVPDLSKGVSMEVGIGVANVASVAALEMYSGARPVTVHYRSPGHMQGRGAVEVQCGARIYDRDPNRDRKSGDPAEVTCPRCLSMLQPGDDKLVIMDDIEPKMRAIKVDYRDPREPVSGRPDETVIAIEEVEPVSRPLKQPNNVRLAPSTVEFTSRDGAARGYYSMICECGDQFFTQAAPLFVLAGRKCPKCSEARAEGEPNVPAGLPEPNTG